MKARFETKNALRERLLFIKTQALTLIYLGIVLFAFAIIIGVTMMVTVKILPGALILVIFIITGVFCITMGATGTTKLVKSNTLTANSTLKVTTIFDDRVEEVNECPTARDSRDIGYEYVAAAGFHGGIFYFLLTDSSYIIAHKDSLVEGDIDEMREFLCNKFGAKYKDKKTKKKGAATNYAAESVDNGAITQTSEVKDKALGAKVDQKNDQE